MRRKKKPNWQKIMPEKVKDLVQKEYSLRGIEPNDELIDRLARHFLRINNTVKVLIERGYDESGAFEILCEEVDHARMFAMVAEAKQNALAALES